MLLRVTHRMLGLTVLAIVIVVVAGSSAQASSGTQNPQSALAFLNIYEKSVHTARRTVTAGTHAAKVWVTDVGKRCPKVMRSVHPSDTQSGAYALAAVGGETLLDVMDIAFTPPSDTLLRPVVHALKHETWTGKASRVVASYARLEQQVMASSDSHLCTDLRALDKHPSKTPPGTTRFLRENTHLARNGPQRKFDEVLRRALSPSNYRKYERATKANNEVYRLIMNKIGPLFKALDRELGWTRKDGLNLG